MIEIIISFVSFISLIKSRIESTDIFDTFGELAIKEAFLPQSTRICETIRKKCSFRHKMKGMNICPEGWLFSARIVVRKYLDEALRHPMAYVLCLMSPPNDVLFQ